ncbi:hypothetical protein OAE73_00890 [bacterium]|nr:hypothetical protein [bacterium]
MTTFLIILGLLGAAAALYFYTAKAGKTETKAVKKQTPSGTKIKIKEVDLKDTDKSPSELIKEAIELGDEVLIKPVRKKRTKKASGGGAGKTSGAGSGSGSGKGAGKPVRKKRTKKTSGGGSGKVSGSGSGSGKGAGKKVTKKTTKKASGGGAGKRAVKKTTKK